MVTSGANSALTTSSGSSVLDRPGLSAFQVCSAFFRMVASDAAPTVSTPFIDAITYLPSMRLLTLLKLPFIANPSLHEASRW